MRESHQEKFSIRHVKCRTTERRKSTKMGRDYYRARGGGGCGNRGGRSSYGSRTSKMMRMTKKVEMKFYPQGTGKYQQMSTYEMVKDYIIQYMQKMYEYGQDIAKSLRDLKVIELDKEEPIRKTAMMTIGDA